MKRFFSKTVEALTSRELLVCLVVYPAIVFGAAWISRLLKPYVDGYAVLFGIISIIIAALGVILTIMEIFNRLMHHRIQGEHLAIRQRKGVDIPDGINERNPK